MTGRTVRGLLLYPKFPASSLWSYRHIMPIVGAKAELQRLQNRGVVDNLLARRLQVALDLRPMRDRAAGPPRGIDARSE
jgi:hypothetical protein